MAGNLFFVESNMTGSQHLSFNRDLLRVLHELYPSRSLAENYFFCSQSHFENVFGNEDQFDAPVHVPVRVIDGRKRKFFLKLIVELFALFTVYFRALVNRPRFIIFASCYPPSLFFISILSLIFSSPTQVILHSEAEALLLRKLGRFNSYSFWINKFFNSGLVSRHLQFYVVGGHSLMHSDTRILLERYNIRAFDHPYFADTALAQHNCVLEESSYNRKYTVAFLGYGRKERGVNHFFDLASKCSSLDSVNFVLVGDVDNRVILPDNLQNLHMPFLGQGFISRDIIETFAKSCDYIFLPYDNFSYRISSSGAMFDALSYFRPIISLQNRYFIY